VFVFFDRIERMAHTLRMDEQIVETIVEGGIGVIPTDTLYGIVASARDPDAVSRVYEVKRRNPNKACIVLVADIDDIEEFGVVLSNELREMLLRYWPGPYSILLPIVDETFSYLDRGTGEIAFRVPDDEELREFLRVTGPLIAPSANTEGDAPATTVSLAQQYFGDSVDFYVDGGERSGPPSTLLRLRENGETEILRG
jgi:L-threonylcarbamoyladenylate synthase